MCFNQIFNPINLSIINFLSLENQTSVKVNFAYDNGIQAGPQPKPNIVDSIFGIKMQIFVMGWG